MSAAPVRYVGRATVPPAAPAPVRHKFPYAPGLDGVRALAVTAVVLYHLGTTGITAPYTARGGFLGVDVFFVLSGFLITSLLLVERVDTGRISIRQFYIRRARRLLPALYTMMAVVAVAAAYLFTDYAARLRGDLIAALTYVTNWWLIAGKSSYFGGGDHLPLLTHLWSLAVEEQFYVVWPLVLILLTRLRRRGAAVVITAVIILASSAEAALLYSPWSDPSRIYYGTDTRLATPLLGALLALATRPWLWRRSMPAGRRRALTGAGVIALILLGGACAVADDQSPWLYRGGFLVVAILSGVLAIAAAHPAAGLGKVLGVPPLRWLGERSYAIYLWHWPIFVLTVPGTGINLNQTADVIVRVAATLIFADLSYRYVEKPLRGGAIGRALAAWRRKTGWQRALGPMKVWSGAVVVLAAAVLVGGQLISAKAPSDVPVGPGPDTSLGALVVPSASPSARPSGSPTTPPAVGPPATVPKVSVFGDSQGMTLLLNVPKDTGKYVAFKDDTIEGCGFLLGRVSSRSGEHHDLAANCPNWLSVWQKRAKKDKPDIGLIMIGAWDVFDITVHGTKLTFNTPAWDDNFTTELAKAIDAVKLGARHVAISLLPCYRPVKGSAGFWPERGDDWRTRHLNTLLTAAAQTDPDNVTTVDPPHQFCDDPKIAKSLSYRWDGVHYYKPGALLYCQAVIPQLLAIKE